MAKKKAPQRVGETHVQAVRDTFPGWCWMPRGRQKTR